MGESSAPIVVGLGELLWDCFPDGRRPGGATANVAFHAQQLGYAGVVCSRVGDDDPGRDLLGYLDEHGLDTRYIQRDADHPTGTVTVDLSQPDRPEYIIHENVAWDFITFSDDLAGLMGRAAAVCFGSLGQRSPASRAAIQQCIATATGALRVFDVNLRQWWYDREVIEQSLRGADIAKLNIEEVEVLARLLEAPDEPVAFAHNLLVQYQLEMVCITRAERGCLLIEPDKVVDAPGAAVQVVDTVGAGDAFSAALIAGRLRGWPLETIAAFANGVGGLVASQAGAMPALKERYAVLIDNMDTGDTPLSS